MDYVVFVKEKRILNLAFKLIFKMEYLCKLDLKMNI